MSKILWVDDDINNPELRPDLDALNEKEDVGYNDAMISAIDVLPHPAEPYKIIEKSLS